MGELADLWLTAPPQPLYNPQTYVRQSAIQAAAISLTVHE
jgi:hypothetical protein